MKINLLKGKSTRTKTYAVITLVATVLLILLNLLVRYLGIYRNVYLDMTPERLYTVSERMKEECSFIDRLDDGEKELKITFCTDPDILMASTVTRVTYFMALALDSMFDNLTVETVNVTYNPTAVEDYKTTSLSTVNSSDIIISYGDRYRIATANSFWVTSGDKYFSYNGEYKLASLLMSVTAVNRPAAYFVTDHGETYYDPSSPDSEASLKTAAFYDLLTERGLEVRTLSLSEVDSIPDDCVLLIINNPRTDLVTDPDRYDELGYVSEAEKLDRYIVSSYGSIMIAKDYAIELPVLDDFLYEWGFDCSNTLVRDESSSLADEDNTCTDIIGVYDKDENSYAYAIYGEYAALASAPSMIFENTGYMTCSFGDKWSGTEAGTYTASKNYTPFFYTTENAKAYQYSELTGGYTDLSADGVMHLAGVCTRYEIDTTTSEHKYSYVFCANSPDFFASSTLGKATYANYDILSALTNNMARTDEYASIELGGVSYNSPSIGGKQLVDETLSATDEYSAGVLVTPGLNSTAIAIYTTVIFAVPAVIAVIGVVRLVKRRFL